MIKNENLFVRLFKNRAKEHLKKFGDKEASTLEELELFFSSINVRKNDFLRERQKLKEGIVEEVWCEDFIKFLYEGGIKVIAKEVGMEWNGGEQRLTTLTKETVLFYEKELEEKKIKTLFEENLVLKSNLKIEKEKSDKAERKINELEREKNEIEKEKNKFNGSSNDLKKIIVDKDRIIQRLEGEIREKEKNSNSKESEINRLNRLSKELEEKTINLSTEKSNLLGENSNLLSISNKLKNTELELEGLKLDFMKVSGELSILEEEKISLKRELIEKNKKEDEFKNIIEKRDETIKNWEEWKKKLEENKWARKIANFFAHPVTLLFVQVLIMFVSGSFAFIEVQKFGKGIWIALPLSILFGITLSIISFNKVSKGVVVYFIIYEVINGLLFFEMPFIEFLKAMFALLQALFLPILTVVVVNLVANKRNDKIK
jgi:hypothetical protein